MRRTLTMLWRVVICVTLCGNSLLFAQRAGDMVGLAMHEEVLKELGIGKDSPVFAELSKLSDAQSKDVVELRVKSEAQGQKDLLETQQRVERIVHSNYRPELQKLLTPEQFTRLQQLSWRRMGSSALLDDDLSKALNITQEQWEKLVAAKAELELNTRNLFRTQETFTPQNGEILQKKSAELNQIWKQKSNDILSPEQQEKLVTLLGKPFDTKLYVRKPRSANIIAHTDDLIGLSLMKPVLQELGIPQEAAAVAELQKLLKARRLELLQKLQSMLPEERTSNSHVGLAAKMAAKYDAELQGILNAEQYLRVRQIRVQGWGMNAFRRPEIAKTLDITTDQRQELDNLTFVYSIKERELLRPNNTPLATPSPEVLKKVRELKLIAIEKAIQILNSEQRDKYAELRGKPFDLTLLEPASDPQPLAETP